MTFHVITIFPRIFDSYLRQSIMARALKKRILAARFFNPRDFVKDKHKKIDDRPYGGGPGMVMMAAPILKAVVTAAKQFSRSSGRFAQPDTRKSLGGLHSRIKTIILSPRGKKLTNAYARHLARKYSDVILICGRYEGIDARVKKILRAEEISVGDYVLSGGEVPAMAVMEATARQLPGFLGKAESLEESRLASGEIYTRPEILKYPLDSARGKKTKNYKVPKVLLSGHHEKIEKWKKNRKDKNAGG